MLTKSLQMWSSASFKGFCKHKKISSLDEHSPRWMRIRPRAPFDKREGVPKIGTKLLKTLRGFCTSKERDLLEALRGKFRGSKGVSRKHLRL